ncbi:hypothetical protein HYH03_005065 [Edaphochlamys debaryana]|uniref:WW domain-containing protein n=1 Tax=Edaphochlamys debaryana TaxID=47281 RepID=A0A835Y8H9_9CHLO|nr:hypothetical protein HYH03_005065 [Edaphochlamys debaryana]|eukprot:KAG2497069.1 hypothetical protein HYH03_005065 [Edaphochlamys debaryana]
MAASRALCACLAMALLAVAMAKVSPTLTDKLVDLIKKKELSKFVEELQLKDMDVNQPDSKGTLPLIEAVRGKDFKFVDALLQYGALAKSKDPATGTTPLHVAFQTNNPQIARFLLSFGADPNATDKAGKKAREISPSKEIADLIATWDKEGAMAFEDPPGTWAKKSEKSSEEYWFNVKTGESRWTAPPSAAWQRIDMQGQPIKYTNYITGQTVAKCPPPLAWVKVRADGKEMFYNWKINFTQVEKPEEVPKELLEDIEKNVNQRWLNQKTLEWSWSDPTFNTPWRELHDAEHDKDYWYNVETGESVWEIPEAMAWTKLKDDESGGHFFHNRLTQDSSWEAPEHLDWVRHDSDL